MVDALVDVPCHCDGALLPACSSCLFWLCMFGLFDVEPVSCCCLLCGVDVCVSRVVLAWRYVLPSQKWLSLTSTARETYVLGAHTTPVLRLVKYHGQRSLETGHSVYTPTMYMQPRSGQPAASSQQRTFCSSYSICLAGAGAAVTMECAWLLDHLCLFCCYPQCA